MFRYIYRVLEPSVPFMMVEKSVASSLRAATTGSKEEIVMLAVLPKDQIPLQGIFPYMGMTKGGGRLEQ